jgi:hypothetical protein
MSLLAIYDQLLGDVAGQLAGHGDEIAARAQLLRRQLAERVVGELGMDTHSFALPALTAYLGQAARLYLLGFYDAAIVEAVARSAAALRGRLLSRVLWDEAGTAAAPWFAALRGDLAGHPDLPAPATPAAIARLYRERGVDALEAVPFAALIAHGDAAGLFAGPWRERVVASLRELAGKRAAIDARDRDQGRQITLAAVESGARSGGPGAAHTEPILGYYLSWGANLHALLADALVAVCLLLSRAGAPATPRGG